MVYDAAHYSVTDRFSLGAPMRTLCLLLLLISVETSFAFLKVELSGNYMNCAMSVCFSNETRAAVYMNSELELVQACETQKNSNKTSWFVDDVQVQDQGEAIDFFRTKYTVDGNNFESLMNGPISCTELNGLVPVEATEDYRYAMDVNVLVKTAEEVVVAPTGKSLLANPTVNSKLYGENGCDSLVEELKPENSCEAVARAGNLKVTSAYFNGSCIDIYDQPLMSACLSFGSGYGVGERRIYSGSNCDHLITVVYKDTDCDRLNSLYPRSDFKVESYRDAGGVCKNRALNSAKNACEVIKDLN